MSDHFGTLCVKGLNPYELSSTLKLFLKKSKKSYQVNYQKHVHRIVRETRFKYIWEYSGVPIPANIYLFKVNNRNTRKRCEMSSKLTTKTPKTPEVFLVFLLLILKTPTSFLHVLYPLLLLFYDVVIVTIL